MLFKRELIEQRSLFDLPMSDHTEHEWDYYFFDVLREMADATNGLTLDEVEELSWTICRKKTPRA
jgi:hypothetical protein